MSDKDKRLVLILLALVLLWCYLPYFLERVISR